MQILKGSRSIVFALPLYLSACVFGQNQQFFSEVSGVAGGASAVGGSNAAPSPSATPGTTTSTAIVFKSLKPALAVRGASCLFCHANVNANVISDFGYGDAFFFDHNDPNVAGSGANGGAYSDWFEAPGFANDGTGSWATATVNGSLIVPKANLDHSYSLVQRLDPSNAVSSMTLAQVIQSPRLNSNGTASQPAMSSLITPAAGSAAVVEKSAITIRAPQASEILALAPALSANGFQAISVAGLTPSLPLSGLQIVGSGSTSYVSNIDGQDFVCTGDVVVRGVLFLNNVNLKTDNNGCRLYVSGSVFMQGALTYVGTDLTTPNLQITSAKMIGLGFDSAGLSYRLALTGDRSFTLPRFKTRANSDAQTLHESFVADANEVLGMVYAQDGSAPVPFIGLLLNAPEVHSRYTGNFTGAVVAEIAMFHLGEFQFTFDSTFTSVPILPALSSDILSVSDN